jgi:hypothetical protein
MFIKNTGRPCMAPSAGLGWMETGAVVEVDEAIFERMTRLPAFVACDADGNEAVSRDEREAISLAPGDALSPMQKAVTAGNLSSFIDTPPKADKAPAAEAPEGEHDAG